MIAAAKIKKLEGRGFEVERRRNKSVVLTKGGTREIYSSLNSAYKTHFGY